MIIFFIILALMMFAIMFFVELQVTPSQIERIMEINRQKQTNSNSTNPLSPTQQLNENVKETNRTVYCLDRYIQHQKLIDGKWVLHNINGPAVIDMLENKEYFFIDGIKYQDELQYLVAKETYEN